MPVRLTAWASAAGFALLAGVLVVVGAVPWSEAGWAAAAAALALVPSGRWSGDGMSRRAAELLLVPAAFALTMVGSTAMRRMMVPPLLLLVAWTAAAATWRRVPVERRPLLGGALGLSMRAATGLGLAGFGVWPVVVSVAVAVAAPWAAAKRLGPRAMTFAALVAAVLPWQRWPLPAAAATAACIASGWTARARWRTPSGVGWVPGLGAAALFAASLAAWPIGPGFAIFPGVGWGGLVAVAAAALLTLRLPPGAAGAAWFAVVLALGAPLAPTPEHRAFDLSAELGTWIGPPAGDAPWLIDLDVRGGAGLDPETPVAVVRFAGREHLLRAPAPGATVVWRPGAENGRFGEWRSLTRLSFDVPPGERPEMARHPGLAEEVTVRVETVGAATPTPPRSWPLARWLPAAAIAVLALQLLAGTWRDPLAVVAWLPLVLGGLLARAAVEPLHLAAERLAPDIALAALAAAWLPAAARWLHGRRVALAVASLLVPLALATPHLTPPLYGDEPFHLVVMDSLAGDRDLDIADDLDLAHHPQNELYAPGRPLFQSPGLAMLLLPGYLLAGRSGALLVLAVIGAAMAALVARRVRDLGVAERRVSLLVAALAITYPLATFATQVWSELPGALAVAALLVLAARAGGGRVVALAVACGSAAIKTRLALLTFPIAAAIWLRRHPLRGVVALAAAAAAALAAGWLAMGHPFGPYRRFHHLFPTDPVLAIKVIGGLLFDPAGGLIFNAPLLVLAAFGASVLWRRGETGERALLAGCALTVVALLASGEWYGGGAPPARYLVPMLPALALAGGLLLQKADSRRRLGLVLLPPSLVVWWMLVTHPHRSINPGDGGYWLADDLARRFAADARSLFPSFLVPNTATFVVPLAMAAAVVLAIRVTGARPTARAALRRSWIALWLVAAAGVVLALELRTDRVVELEAPQVQRRGGSAVPQPGAVARYSQRRGWRLDDGNSVSVPLHLRDGSSVVVEGWALGTARRRAELEVQWDDGETMVVPWVGGEGSAELELPPPPGGGSRRLGIALRCPPQGALVLDRLRIGRPQPGPGTVGRR